MHLEKSIVQISRFQQPLISITQTSCPANFINLSAILVELRMAEYGSKLMRFANRDKRGRP